MSDCSSDVLDHSALDELRTMTGNDPEFFNEMIDTFLSDGPVLISAMTKAASAADVAGLRLAAHTLKSNCRAFGATRLADACLRIEQQAAAGALEGIEASIAGASGLYPQVVAALQAERSTS